MREICFTFNFEIMAFYHELLKLERLFITQLSNYESPTIRLLIFAGGEEEEE